jgi:hypothetical protein
MGGMGRHLSTSGKIAFLYLFLLGEWLETGRGGRRKGSSREDNILIFSSLNVCRRLSIPQRK